MSREIKNIGLIGAAWAAVWREAIDIVLCLVKLRRCSPKVLSRRWERDRLEKLSNGGTKNL